VHDFSVSRALRLTVECDTIVNQQVPARARSDMSKVLPLKFH